MSANGVEADSLQTALAGVIEHQAHPPSIIELNYLGEQIQRMSEKERLLLEKEISGNYGVVVKRQDPSKIAGRTMLIIR